MSLAQIHEANEEYRKQTRAYIARLRSADYPVPDEMIAHLVMANAEAGLAGMKGA